VARDLIVSSSYPAHDREVFWPNPNLIAADPPPAAFASPTFLALDTLQNMRAETQLAAIAASNQVAGAGHHGYFSPATMPGSLWAQTRCEAGASRAYGFEGLSCPMTMSGTYLAAGVTLPSLERVYRLRVFLFTDDAITTTETRILLTPFITAGGAGPPRASNVVGVSNKGGFGIAGDGANQWRFVSYDRSGVNLLRETVALPAHTQSQVNCFEAVRLNAQPGVDPSWVFRWNGEDVIARDYTAGLLEPCLAGEWGYTPTIECNSAIQQTPNYRFNCRWGRFLPNGVQVTG